MERKATPHNCQQILFGRKAAGKARHGSQETASPGFNKENLPFPDSLTSPFACVQNRVQTQFRADRLIEILVCSSLSCQSLSADAPS